MAVVDVKPFCRLAARLFIHKNSALTTQQLPFLCRSPVFKKLRRNVSHFRHFRGSEPLSTAVNSETSCHVDPVSSGRPTRLQLLRCVATQSQSDRYTLKNDTFRNYLNHLLSEHDMINKLITAEEIKIEARHLHLRALALRIQALHERALELEETQKLIDGLPTDETELKHLATEELAVCQEEIDQLEREVVDLLTPDRSADHNDVILELTAGVGGQEAMLFCAEIFQMYENFAFYKGWSFQQMSYEKSETGGLRRASASISGPFVYKFLKFEGGVHRVQRVPKTEKAGRVHTSTMTVAVLPQPTEIDITLNSKDLQIETCRASGKGGQHVNTTDSAVRILHLPTGMFAECQEERSQIKNKDTAMKVLKSRIYQKFLDEQISQQQAARKFQIGTAGRSEKIRTYNFSQDRVTDHRLHQSLFSIERFMNGKEQLDSLLCELLRESRLEILEETLTKFVEEQKTAK